MWLTCTCRVSFITLLLDRKDQVVVLMNCLDTAKQETSNEDEQVCMCDLASKNFFNLLSSIFLMH